MAKDRGAAPARRGPSRNGRASFDRQGSSASFASNNTDEPADHNISTLVEDGQAWPGSQRTHQQRQSIAENMGSPSDLATSNGKRMSGSSSNKANHYQASTDNNNSSTKNPIAPLRINASLAPPGAAAQPSPAPRGRGRPRKKPLESPQSASTPSTPHGFEEPSPVAPQPYPATTNTSICMADWNGVGDGAGHHTQPIQPKRSPEERYHGGAVGEDEGEEGNESDDWSEEDDVHYLPTHIKAQFGNVVWAKHQRSPPWPGLVWDPRFLGKDKNSRAVARHAYAALGKSQLVKFFDRGHTFAAIPYKNIVPFDMAALPANLKACTTSKKKDALKEDAQVAFEAFKRTRAERLAEMHAIGRWGANKTPAKSPKNSKPAKSTAASKNDSAAESAGLAEKAAAAASPPATGGARRETPKKRGRGRPRKVPVKELDDDAPSAPSSGAEYELEMPASVEGNEEEDGGEDGAGATGRGGVEESREDEMEDSQEESEEEDGGDDDDEEEYTAEADPDADEEDDKLLDESFIKESAGRKRGRPRSSGDPGRASSSASKISYADNDWEGKKAHKRSRQSSSAEDSDSGGGGGGGKKSGKVMAPGEGKAKALAFVQAYMATLPPMEIGRDEGWIATKEEARAAGLGGGAGGSKRSREKERGEGKGREKKTKSLKASSKEGKLKEEEDRKRQLLQMKSSPEPVWKQALARKQEGQPPAKDKSRSADAGGGAKLPSVKAPTASTGEGGGKEGNVQKAFKLTQRLAEASSEAKFNNDEVLDILRKLGELDPSVELLKQSGCGKAVASVRKYYSGSQQVKHNDKEVADAASTLRQRWMEALGKATAPNASGTTVTAGSGEMLSAAPTPSRARSEPASWQSSSKKQSEKLPRSGSGRDSPRQRSSTGDGRAGGQERKSRDDVGGRYGGGSRGDEAQGRPARAGTGTGSGIDEKVAEGDKEKVGAAGAAVAVVKEDVKPPAVVLEEPRRRAVGMLMTVLGSAAAAVERCAAIEQELYESQGNVLGNEYLRRLRTAVFSMEGSGAQRLRDKVMSEMVLPRDFATKAADELRSLAGMV